MGPLSVDPSRSVISLLPRAEQLASLEAVQRAVGAGSGASEGPGRRAEFWRLRGLRRGAKKTTQRSREDLSDLTRQGHYPPYERVVLREGGTPARGAAEPQVKVLGSPSSASRSRHADLSPSTKKYPLLVIVGHRGDRKGLRSLKIIPIPIEIGKPHTQSVKRNG